MNINTEINKFFIGKSNFIDNSVTKEEYILGQLSDIKIYQERLDSNEIKLLYESLDIEIPIKSVEIDNNVNITSLNINNNIDSDYLRPIAYWKFNKVNDINGPQDISGNGYHISSFGIKGFNLNTVNYTRGKDKMDNDAINFGGSSS